MFIPFQEKIKDSQNSKIFDRFFYLASNIIAYGKSIYQTNEYVNIDSPHITAPNNFFVPYEYGHSSHFRNNLKRNNLILNISQLYFDMNYLKCYY